MNMKIKISLPQIKSKILTFLISAIFLIRNFSCREITYSVWMKTNIKIDISLAYFSKCKAIITFRKMLRIYWYSLKCWELVSQHLILLKDINLMTQKITGSTFSPDSVVWFLLPNQMSKMFWVEKSRRMKTLMNFYECLITLEDFSPYTSTLSW